MIINNPELEKNYSTWNGHNWVAMYHFKNFLAILWIKVTMKQYVAEN